MNMSTLQIAMALGAAAFPFLIVAVLVWLTMRDYPSDPGCKR